MGKKGDYALVQASVALCGWTNTEGSMCWVEVNELSLCLCERHVCRGKQDLSRIVNLSALLVRRLSDR